MGDNACCALIRQIHCALQKHANNGLRDAGLTFAQVNLLFMLRDHMGGSCSLKELERVLGVAQSTTAGLVKRTEEKGFIESFGSEKDKRIKSIRLTEAGRAVCLTAVKQVQEMESKAMESLSGEERSVLYSLLSKMYANISEPGEQG